MKKIQISKLHSVMMQLSLVLESNSLIQSVVSSSVFVLGTSSQS